MTARFDYLRDPQQIYRRSFAQARAATDLSTLPEPLRPLALRLVHACAQPEIVADLAWGGDPAVAGRAALAAAAPLLCDCKMVAAGIIRARLPAANPVVCTLDHADTPALAARLGTTRSAAAVELWRSRLAGAVVVVGNAPTTLFRLLETLYDDAPRPALILGFPVGFVGAAESKQALIDSADELGVAFLTLRGRFGGSALAAAAVNALHDVPG